MAKRLFQVLSILAIVLVFLPATARAQMAPSPAGVDIVSIGMTEDTEGTDRTVIGAGLHVAVLGGLLDVPTLVDFGPGVMAGLIDSKGTERKPGFWGLYLPLTVAFTRDDHAPALHFAVGYMLGGARARSTSENRRFYSAGLTLRF